MKHYREHLSDPWYTYISNELKTVEGRINTGDFAKMNVGDIITFYSNNMYYREIRVIIKGIRYYPNFKMYLEGEGLEKTLPYVDTIDMGLKIYNSYYSIEQETNYGVVALDIRRIFPSK